jgi:hypothetical protein
MEPRRGPRVRILGILGFVNSLEMKSMLLQDGTKIDQSPSADTTRLIKITEPGQVSQANGNHDGRNPTSRIEGND